ncbi:MAG: hypothetical protein IPK77_10775 [Cellvibrio sp.]|nr:hypothetical protein [Cellvibrio sp.]
MKKLIIVGIAALSLIASSVLADANPKQKRIKKHHKPPVTRQVDRVRTENGFERDMTKTNAKGETATRHTSVVNDKETQTRTRTVTGTHYNGGEYSGQSVTQKTEDGYTRDATRTNSQGKTTTRSVDATIDKEAGTVTKNISVTNPEGETKDKVIVRPLPEKKN